MEEENLAEKLFKLNSSINHYLTETKELVNQIKARQDPRRQFNLWRNSSEGKNSEAATGGNLDNFAAFGI